MKLIHARRLVAGAFCLGAFALAGCDTSRGKGIIGRPAPPITAAGWFNGKAPTEADLKGKVVVIDAWASWCGPCRSAAPRMVWIYNQFKGQDVVFVGLSSEDASTLDEMKAFVADANIPWVNGYGAVKTQSALQITAIPTTIVIGKDGLIKHYANADVGLEQAIKKALAEK